MAQRAPLREVRSNRIPPQNLDAEQSVLGAMLESKEAIANVVEVLDAEDFYKPAHAQVFEAILDLYGRGEPADAITIAEELGRRGQLEGIGGKPYIHGLLEAYPTAGSAAHYARIVEENAVLRRLINAGNEVQEIGFSLPEDVEGAVDEAEALVYKVGDRRLRADIHPIRGLLSENMEMIETLYERGEHVTGLSSGFPDLDEMTAGFQPSNLIIIAARPSMGKTSILGDFMLHAATRLNQPAVIFSLEMSRHEVVQRFLSSEARVDSQRMRRGSLQENDWTRLSTALGRLAEAPLFIDDSPNITLMEMRAKCRRLKARHGLSMVVIDYLQLMQSPRKSENRQQEVSEISRALKILARELEIPVICASQLNRGVEYRADKRPLLADLRESGCVTADTRVLRADTNVPTTFGDLFRSGERDIPVWTVNEDYRVVRGTMSHVFESGVKRVFRVKLRSGREVKASANHPFLSFDGWRRVDELELGERVAIARSLPSPIVESSLTDDQVVLLAHLIGDGCFASRQPLHYTSASRSNIEAVSDAARKAFGISGREVPQSTWWHLYLSAGANKWHPNPVRTWLRELGIDGQRSKEKCTPEAVFGLPDEQIGLFLRHLWATDGHISLRKTRSGLTPIVYYATSSRRLADDVALLLLRFGIVARIRTSSKKGYGPMYSVYVGSGEHVRAFVTNVGAFGPKKKGLMEVARYLASHAAKAHWDTVPADVWQDVMVRASQARTSFASLQLATGHSFSSSFSAWASPSRQVVRDLGTHLKDSQLVSLGTSDLFWDEVVDIEPLGTEAVFDATVHGTHNFLAEGVVLENSIEQDSDLVMFLYRDEVYNPDTEARGEAELIVAKHRNGPTGLVRLAFMNQYTKFASIAKGPTG